jgi:hypothetical protein
MIMNNGWPRRIHRLLASVAIASAISFAGARTVLAQAGSTGGTIGKEDKSVSGGEPAGVSRPAKNHRQERNARAPVAAPDHSSSDTSCRSIVGTWTSWAAGMYGRSDTRINANGTIEHPASTGTWSCSGGKYLHTWEAFGVRGPYRLSPDGRRLVKIQDGSVSFSR